MPIPIRIAGLLLCRQWFHLLMMVGMLFAWLPGYTQQHQEALVVFYNVENLFDTIDDPHRNDNEFLPDGKNEWTTVRFTEKIRHLGRALTALPGGEAPAIVGLAEVENRSVLEELIRDPQLSSVPYRIILEEGDDPRGIDVGVIFRQDQFSYLSHSTLRSSRQFRTRHILFVTLLGKAGDTLHLFVNHWKSRSGGEAKTRPKRIETASLLRESVDSLFRRNPATSIIIMGDLNDEPADSSILITLGANPIEKRPKTSTLYNLFYDRYHDGEGTLWYRDWDLFDQIIVSGNLLSRKRRSTPRIHPYEGYILTASFLLQYDKDGNQIPYRSYRRGYRGGYSDHLPVYIRLQY